MTGKANLMKGPNLARSLERLGSLEWDQPERVADECAEILPSISTPAAIGELLSDVLASRAKLAKCESWDWGERLVLFDDPDADVRLRLHVFSGGRDAPHNHRWSFTSLVLHGAYQHLLYGDIDRFLEHCLLPEPVLVRRERKASSYTFGVSGVHSIDPMPGSVSLVIRGPAVCDDWYYFGPDGEAMSQRVQSPQPARVKPGDERSVGETLKYLKSVGLA